MPCSYADFPGHSDMAAYLDAYANAFGLREFIRFRASAERLEPDPSGGWWLTLADGSVQKYRSVVVAIGLFWCLKVPDYPGVFGATTIHSHQYRTPEPFAGRRVLVVGAGQSAAEIAVEISRVASRTFMSVRSGTHVLPRWIGGKPYDARDIAPFNMIPWRLMNLVFRLRVAQELGPAPASWPVGIHRLLEAIPIVSSDLLHPSFPRTCSPRCAGETSWSSRRSIGSFRIGCTSSTSRKRCWTASSTAPATASATPSCHRRWCRQIASVVLPVGRIRRERTISARHPRRRSGFRRAEGGAARRGPARTASPHPARRDARPAGIRPRARDGRTGRRGSGPPTSMSPPNSWRSSSSTGPTSPCTRRALWSTRSRLVEKTIFGIGFQIRANSRIATVAAGSVSPVGQ
jgi:hypothetical protein